MLTAFGYGAAFMFQVAFCAYFDIPREFIRIALEDVITGALLLSGFGVAIGSSLFFCIKSQLQRSPTAFTVFLLVVVVFMLGMVISYFGGYWLAGFKKTFPSIPAHQLVVLQRYGDFLVCRKFSEPPFVLKDGCQLLPITTLSNETFIKMTLEKP
jgi:hypothetical protein